MELEHSFTVPVPEERAWEVLLDVKRVAPGMQGSTRFTSISTSHARSSGTGTVNECSSSIF